MAENIPPPVDGADDIYAEMQRLSRDTQRVRSAHFIAAQRKNRKAKLIGVLVIVLNVLIGSGLIEAVVTEQSTVTTVIKALAFLAAALAGIQTFFNFQKEVECHTNAGGVYGSINRRLGLVMAEYQETPANRNALITDFRALSAEYLQANEDSEGCVPTDSDYDKARAGIERRRGGEGT
ncbi:MAG TPA: SLATT domain-containing protein [Pyrinomonadaceae bacterium]|nr:SLATT domain-containing protein [Pyrinomonadaceae bacterium]